MHYTCEICSLLPVRRYTAFVLYCLHMTLDHANGALPCLPMPEAAPRMPHHGRRRLHRRQGRRPSRPKPPSLVCVVPLRHRELVRVVVPGWHRYLRPRRAHACPHGAFSASAIRSSTDSRQQQSLGLHPWRGTHCLPWRRMVRCRRPPASPARACPPPYVGECAGHRRSKAG